MLDERIKHGYYKIRNEAALIIYFAAVASFLIKTLILGYSFNQVVFEFIVMIFFPVYQTIRAHQMGLEINMEKDGRNLVLRNILLALFCGIVCIAYLYFKTGEQGWTYNDIIEKVGFLISYVAAFSMIRILFLKYEKKRAKDLEKKYDD
ncbi:hypothetical protein MUJ63_05710 [Lachnospiraceae bacterium NSJ-143]|mgnify:CR=1 FL=1|nr:hypothetical protein [Lachnospiraceae bacterium NSJ-143]